MTKINWIADPELENSCQEAGATWKVADVNVSTEVNIKGSLENNARLGDSIIDNNVYSCAKDMELGRPIHYISLRKIPGKQYMVIGGNHRIAAMDLLSINIAKAYIITCNNEQYDSLTRADNRRMRSQNLDEAIEQCLWMHAKYGTSLTALGDEWAVDPKVLHAALRNSQMREELEKHGINPLKLSKTSLDKLNPFRNQKAVLYRLAHLIEMYAPKNTVMDEMTRALQKLTTEQQKMDYLVRQEPILQQSAPRPGRKRVKTPLKNKLFRLLGHKDGTDHLLSKGGKKQVPITDIRQLDFDPSDAANFVALWERIKKPLEILYTQSKDYVHQVEQANKKKR